MGRRASPRPVTFIGVHPPGCCPVTSSGKLSLDSGNIESYRTDKSALKKQFKSRLRWSTPTWQPRSQGLSSSRQRRLGGKRVPGNEAGSGRRMGLSEWPAVSWQAHKLFFNKITLVSSVCRYFSRFLISIDVGILC